MQSKDAEEVIFSRRFRNPGNRSEARAFGRLSNGKCFFRSFSHKKLHRIGFFVTYA
jgi:hypothetical protein